MNLSPTVFALGVSGGALGEVLKWYQLRESPNLSEYAKQHFYWIITALIILVGGMLALLQGLDSTKPLLALNIGISAPLILKSLANMVPSEKSPATRGLRGSEGQIAKPRAIDFNSRPLSPIYSLGSQVIESREDGVFLNSTGKGI